MKTSPRPRRRGFTLLELTLAVGIGMMIAAMGLLLFQQQMAFIRIFRAQDFLTREAPLINNYLVRVIAAAEGFQLYEDVEALTGNESPVLGGAEVLVLRFRQPDGTTRATAITFEDPGGGKGVYYRLIDENGIVQDADWAISKEPQAVTFAIEAGILRIRMAGPNGEQLVYSGSEKT